VAVAQVVARYVVHELEKKEGGLREAFEFLEQFPAHFSMIFARFLDLVNPVFLHNHVKPIFMFGYEQPPADILKLKAFFGKNIRVVIFSDVFATNACLRRRFRVFVKTVPNADRYRYRRSKCDRNILNVEPQSANL
jgi:hypothetical protein